MSAAAAAEAAEPAPKKGKKKLIIIIAVVLVLLLGGGGGAFFMMKKKAAAEHADAADAEHEAAPAKKAKVDLKTPPAFVPLEPFTVNLADRDNERYLQVAVTLQVSDAKVGDQIKAFLPAIRNNILMVLAHKTSAELLEREGKDKLAQDIARETERALGIEHDEEEADEDETAKKKKKKKKKKSEEPALINQVHFGNFIIQ